jgi:uncharacterized membrane protein
MNGTSQKGITSFLALHRLSALTDGVFAIVMTLLVLEIAIPEIAPSLLHEELPQRLIDLWPKLLSYIVSFLILGIFWYLHHLAFRYIKRSDNGLIWLNILFLMFVALIPFSTSLFGSYGEEQLPIVIYAVNIILVMLTRFTLWTYATRKYRLVDRDISPRAIKWDGFITLVLFIIFILVIGVSFVSVTAARGTFGLLGVSGIIMAVMSRKIYKE